MKAITRLDQNIKIVNDNRLTIGRVAKTMSPWKVKLIDFILNRISFLKIGFTNRLLKRLEDYRNGDFARILLEELNITTEVYGLHHMVKDGPVTIACNHPGGGDIMAVVEAIDRIRKDIMVPANEIVCVRSIEEISVPVRMMGKNKIDKNVLHQSYKEGRVVLFFAGGKNSRYNEEGLLRDRKWRTTFLDFAQQYNTPIQLFRIDGKNSPLFYKVAAIRKKYSFLKNIPLENLFQLRELTRSTHMKLYLSNPFYYNTKNETEEQKREKADILYNFLYEMSETNLEFKQSI